MRAGPRSGGGAVLLGVGGLTLGARVVGFARSLVFSKTVGDTCLGDVYNAANQLPNVLFEVVAGGVLAGVVIPVVARHVGAGRRPETERTVSALLTWTLLVLSVVVLVTLLGVGVYARAYAKRDCTGSADVLAALLTMFVPQLWFYGVAVVSAGVLQAHHRFLAAAAAPLVSSAVVMAAYLVFAALNGPPTADDLGGIQTAALRVLGLGTTAGVLALALGTVWPLARSGLRLRPRLRFAAGDAAVIGALAGAGVVGLILQQLSVLVLSFSAQRTADPGALTRFTWANAVYLLPYAVLAAPLLQVVFPRLATAAEQGAAEVAAVLRTYAPLLGVLGWLGASVLIATAVPVARVFVLGPGSGRTAALAAPIAAFAPAVPGFALLGLATRALLAQHRAWPAGVATATAWGTVIGAVLVVRVLVAPASLVTALAGSVSLGMIVGALVGWLALIRTLPTAATGLGPALLAGAAAAAPAAAAGALLARPAAGLGLIAALALSFAVGALSTAVFAAVLALVRPSVLRGLWELRRPRSVTEQRG